MDISLKRIVAYTIDIILVTFVATMISELRVINPYLEKYEEKYTEYVKLIQETDEEISENQLVDYNYYLYKYRVVSNTISIVCLLLYFGLFQYTCDGQTIGKKLLKLKVVSKNEKKLTIFNYFLRVLILNNIIFTGLAIVSVLIFSPNKFYYITYGISLMQSIILIITLLFMVLREDHRGLHDMVANTMVIDLRNEIIETEEV